MSLILPDEELKKLATSELWTACSCSGCEKDRERFRAIARAQARHMAREIVALRSDYDRLSALAFKDKYGFKEVHNFEKSLFAWLRQEGVM